MQRRRFVFFLLVLVSGFAGVGHADSIRMKNGNFVEGRIVEEDDERIIIDTGGVKLTIRQDEIERLERNIPVQFLQNNAEKGLNRAASLMEMGRSEEARLLLDGILLEFDKVEEQYKGEDAFPQTLEDLRSRMRQLQRSALPPDPSMEQAERLFEQALDEIDHIRYEEAFPLLEQAVALVPGRSDIRLRLAETAERTDRPRVAIEAYQKIVRDQPNVYYEQVSLQLLKLLEARAEQLMKERRMSAAVAAYREILLLKGEKEDDAADLTEYLARKTRQEAQPEDEVFMEVYRYADSNDLVDLAFAAVTKAADLRPDDHEIQSLRKQTGFLAQLKEYVEDGNLEAAVEVMRDAREELQDTTDFAEKAQRVTEGIERALDAERLIAEAQEAFDKEDYSHAAELAERVATDYSELASAEQARALLSNIEFEKPMKEGLAEGIAHIEERRYEEAERVLEGLKERPGFDGSRYRPEIESLLRSVPDEREASRLYDLAGVLIEREAFQEAMRELEALVSRYPDTAAGDKAQRWLTKYRSRITMDALKTRQLDSNSFLAFADPSLWRATEHGGSLQTRKVSPVPGEAKTEAWNKFNELHELDGLSHQEERLSLLVVLGLPVLVVLGLVGVGAWKLIAPGRGRLPHEAVNSEELTECGICGVPMKEGELVCPNCGESVGEDEITDERRTSSIKKANFDPWDIRVRDASANEFESHFQKAKDLAETNDTEAAIEACRLALHEDPLRKNAYSLLADLYERVNRREEAAKCYREILLIDPADVETRRKIEATLSLTDKPLEMIRVITGVSVTLWLVVYLVAVGIDPGGWFVRFGLMLIGTAITIFGWVFVQKRHRPLVHAHQRPEIRGHRPLPESRLSFRDQHRQAKHIAEGIKVHTGIDVPVLSPTRVVAVAVLSIVFFGALLYVAWLNNTWFLMAIWPVVTVLLYFLLEVFPRAQTAHALLRHFYEETLSPWVDPHRPFNPRRTPAKGEFQIQSLDEFPLRWALNPRPYANTRQGVLGFLQATLNRHWAFHRFYDSAHVVRDIDVPVAIGSRRTIVVLCTLLVVVIVAGASIGWNRFSTETNYENSVKLGYGYLLDGDVVRAQTEFYRASRLKPDRTVPRLYLAHASSAGGMNNTAERAYRKAASLSLQLVEVYNDHGNFLQRQGRINEAVRQYMKALELEPGNADVLNNLGSALLKLGKHDEASERLEKSVALRRRHPRAWTTLGLAYEGMGRFDDARGAYERAVEVAPDAEYTQVARDRLKEESIEELNKPIVLDPDRV